MHINLPLEHPKNGTTWKTRYRPVKVKISLLQAVEAHRVAKGQGSHVTETNGE
jgi:hypothetical protein